MVDFGFCLQTNICEFYNQNICSVIQLRKFWEVKRGFKKHYFKQEFSKQRLHLLYVSKITITNLLIYITIG